MGDYNPLVEGPDRLNGFFKVIQSINTIAKIKVYKLDALLLAISCHFL